MSLKLKLWGIRGSLPTPQTPESLQAKIIHLLGDYRQQLKDHPDLSPGEFVSELDNGQKVGGYGGHTACIQVNSSENQLIVDGGSGIRRLGETLALGKCGLGKGEVDILMTHFHWDHVIGLPFFIPLFIPGNKIRFHAVQDDLEQNIRLMFQKPRFPVPYEALPSEISFHKLEPRVTKEFKDIKVTPYMLDHPDPCWGYRFESGGRTAAYCVDTEGKRVSPRDLGPDLPLYQDVNLMVFDAQYTFIEATEKIDWGHASAPIGIDIAIREKVEKVLFIHHDPAASDQKIAKAEAQTREYYDAQKSIVVSNNLPFQEVDWEFAREGMLVDV